MIKKGIITAIMTSLLAIGIPFATPGTADAQSRYCSCRTVRHRSAHRLYYRRSVYRTSPYAYNSGYSESRYGYSNGYTAVRRPSYYARHRRLVNTAAGAGVGALIGGLLGGRRGVGLGLLGGGLGSQVFTHYQKPKNYTRYRRY
jgi:hypothetical protein